MFVVGTGLFGRLTFQETMMTPRSRKPVLLMSGTNVCGLPKLELLKQSDSLLEEDLKMEEEEEGSSISQSRSMLSTESPVDASFSSRTDDYGYSCNSIDASSLFCVNNDPDFEENDDIDENLSPNVNCSNKRSATLDDSDGSNSKRLLVDKEPVLKPKQYNSDGEAVVFETSF